MKVSSVAQMRALDHRAIEEFGIAEELLMENAGSAVYAVLAERFDIGGRRFAVFCGIGNNGGDGFVVARKVHSNGGLVQVFVLGDPGNFRGAARTNYEIAAGLPFEVCPVGDIEALRTALRPCDAVVDAIFGTGLTRPVEGLHREAIEWINAAGKPVLSIDIPSGVHGDTGAVMGTAVRADHTVTLGLPKVGNMLFPGFDLGGELSVSHISFPPAMYQADSFDVEICPPVSLPRRDPAGHKGEFGQALFVAGAASYYGAPLLASLSFLKAGGGYARLATPRSMAPFMAAQGSEIVLLPQAETGAGSIAGRNLGDLLELAARMDVVVLGPGLSLEEETQQLARDLAAEIDRPLLLDGDGITALCDELQILRDRQAETILTPHLGEMSRITGISVAEISAGRVEVLQRTAADLGATIVLKGPHSLVGLPDGRVSINLTGNSGMATAGSGDVLAGAIAAMFGLGLGPHEAARKGVFLHGLSGDLAARARGEDGITAQDIMDFLPLALKTDREGLPEDLAARYRGPRVVL